MRKQDPLKYGDEKGALENSASTYHVTFYYFEKKIWIIEIKISFFLILISIFSELKYITSFTNNIEFTFLGYSTVVSITLENQLQIHYLHKLVFYLNERNINFFFINDSHFQKKNLKISNLVCTMRFWNKIHQICSKSKE